MVVTLEQKFDSSFNFLYEEVNNISKIFTSVDLLEDVLMLPKPEDEEKSNPEGTKQEEVIKKTIFDKIKVVWKKAQLLWQKIKVELIDKFEKIIEKNVTRLANNVKQNAIKFKDQAVENINKILNHKADEDYKYQNNLLIKRIGADGQKNVDEYLKYIDDCIEKLANAYEANSIEGTKNTLDIIEKKPIPALDVITINCTKQHTAEEMIDFTVEEVEGSLNSIRIFINHSRSDIESYQQSLSLQLKKDKRSKQQLQCTLKAVECFINKLKAFQQTIMMEFKCIFYNEKTLMFVNKLITGKEQDIPTSKYNGISSKANRVYQSQSLNI